MGRKPKEYKDVQRHLRVPEDIDTFIQSEAEKNGISYTDSVNEMFRKAMKKTIAEYKGYRFIKHMTHPYTCFECKKKKAQGDPAWIDEFGAPLCPECAVFKHGFGSKVNVRQDQKIRRMKKLIEDYKKELDVLASEYMEKFIEKANKLERLDVVGKIKDMSEKANERKKMWMRYHEQDYEIEGESEKQAFEEFMRHDDEFLSLLRDMKAEYEKAMEEKRRLLVEKARKERKKKKKQSYAT